jgi:hypothetical protein
VSGVISCIILTVADGRLEVFTKARMRRSGTRGKLFRRGRLVRLEFGRG